jgi:hypothetical protein
VAWAATAALLTSIRAVKISIGDRKYFSHVPPVSLQVGFFYRICVSLLDKHR